LITVPISFVVDHRGHVSKFSGVLAQIHLFESNIFCFNILGKQTNRWNE